MIVHQVFAQIYEGEVKNVMVCDNYELANWISRATYGNEAFAVDCLQYPCSNGDKYHDGSFYHIDPETNEETLIEYVPTQEEQVQELKSSNDELFIAMSDMIGGAYNA